MAPAKARARTEEAAPAPIYLDCNATTPLEPSVKDILLHFLVAEFGNAGSRTHDYGTQAKRAVARAREQVAAVVDARANEVIFTSGATEANNLALLGLAEHGLASGRRHIVSTQIEHKAVLEPLLALERRGFQVDLVPPTRTGIIEPDAIAEAVRTDTLLVSVMHVNNETGVLQPLADICQRLAECDAYLHVDAAQGFGKDLEGLRHKRIDLISASAHKVYGPKGVGALITRRRGFAKAPLAPLTYGGGQERGLRPGTLPVPLIAGFGEAARLAVRDADARRSQCAKFRASALTALQDLSPVFNGDPDRTLPHVLNFSVLGLDSEAVMVALKDMVALSNGSACTSQNYEPSHVLSAMDLDPDVVAGALRISWSHMTPEPDWEEIAARIQALR